MGKIKGKQLKGFWYNPGNGKTTEFSPIENTGNKKFDPPTKGYGQDWVLALYDAAAGYTLHS